MMSRASDEQTYAFDWNELAFQSKKPVSQLDATFIAAPRKLSTRRLKQLIKEYLPAGNIVLGISKETHVDGLDNHPAFEMLQAADIQGVIDTVNAKSPTHHIYYLHYLQRDLPHIFAKIRFKHVALVRGSWHKTFHLQPAYYALANARTPYEYVSPFADEAEALAYNQTIATTLAQSYPMPDSGTFTTEQMLALAATAAQYSLDYTFQTGAVFGRKVKEDMYELVTWSYNRVVPFQTHAMHTGNSREDNYSPANDLNYYDTIHAEMNLLVTTLKQGVNSLGLTLFINLLPCPTCARVLSQTDIAEVIYQFDHSDGDAVKLFAATGKSVKAY